MDTDDAIANSNKNIYNSFSLIFTISSISVLIFTSIFGMHDIVVTIFAMLALMYGLDCLDLIKYGKKSNENSKPNVIIRALQTKLNRVISNSIMLVFMLILINICFSMVITSYFHEYVEADSISSLIFTNSDPTSVFYISLIAFITTCFYTWRVSCMLAYAVSNNDVYIKYTI